MHQLSRLLKYQRTIVYQIMVLLIFLPALALGAGQKPGSSQGSRALMDSCLTAYERQQYPEVAGLCNSVLTRFGSKLEAEEAYVILADVFLRIDSVAAAQSLIEQFKRFHYKSSYIPRILYYEAQVYLRQQKAYDAARTLVSCINISNSRSLFETAKRQMDTLIHKGALLEEELAGVLEKLKYDRELRCRGTFFLSEMQFKAGRLGAAKRTAESWLTEFDGDPGTREVKKLLKKTRKGTRGVSTYLILAPLSGAFSDVGSALCRGIILGLEETLGTDGSWRYKILDTQGNPLTAITKLRKNLEEEAVRGVIGPAMSEVSTAVAVEMSSRWGQIPMVTPTATTFGISNLGENIFQTNVPTAILGERVAQHALNCKGLKEFAILAPNSDYGLDLANAFEQYVLSHGGTILAKEFYNPEVKDYGDHFKVIRHRKARLVTEKQLAMKGRLGERLKQEDFDKVLADSMLYVDGFFLAAANADEASRLSSQLHYHKLKGRIFGASGWYDKRLFHDASRFNQGTIFSLDFTLDKKSSAWVSFHKKFSEKWGAYPDKVAVLGYNAARFLSLVQKSGDDDSTLLNNLKAVTHFPGLQGEIFMDKQGGFNRSAKLFELERKSFKAVNTCDP